VRVLYLAHRVPYPPDKGDKIRAFHEVRGLHDRNHEVHLRAFADDPRDMAHDQALLRICASVRVIRLGTRMARIRSLMAVGGSAPLSLAYFGTSGMRAAVAEAVERLQPDACVTCSSPMVQYVPLNMRPRTLADLVDVDSEKWKDYAVGSRPPMSWIYALEGRRLRAYELRVARTCGVTLLATEREADVLRRELPDPPAANVRALVNGVDADHFRPERAPGEARAAVPATETRFFSDGSAPIVVFTGVMDYRPNEDGVAWFVNQVWPLIRAHCANARFVIAGSKPTPGVRALARAPGVEVTGYVSDTQPYLAAATVCVVPLLLARGVQNKVLEAMACARPVVTTHAAVAGLTVTHGEHVLVADHPPDMAAAVVALIRDTVRRQAMGAAARSFVQREHAWPQLLDRFTALVESLAPRSGSSPAQ
jgi:sugar transferase (PEP-CTERM/EpsH1 system associated)